MKTACAITFCLILTALIFASGKTRGADSALRRVPWNSSRVHGSPEPPLPYVAEEVFTNVKVREGLELVSFNERLFVMERRGKIWSFPESPEVEVQAALFGDLRELHPKLNFAYGLAFHPEATENHQVFVTYTDASCEEDEGTLLSRFHFAYTDAGIPQIEPESEQVVLRWRRGGHNGANLRFGPDGMLYVSTGDGSGPFPPDSLNTGQDNSDLLSSVLRIDIDHVENDLGYRVPSDNPFVEQDGVRPEIWAFGFRNPWKMSFDHQGRLWLGDVGWELWEMIHVLNRGGNYGWSAMEASNPIKPHLSSSLAAITPPVASHAHTEAASITGGFVYHGSRLPELQGAYVYGDYETGILWAMRLADDSREVLEHKRIADTPHKISTFGIGSDGEIYFAHYGSPSSFYRLKHNPRANDVTDFPKKLSETGLFESVATQQPSPGVYEFSIHEPMWHDGAAATRYIAVPGKETIQRKQGAKFSWPIDSVLAKTIHLGTSPVETQLLHYDGDSWNGYSYRWNASKEDADLVPADGDDFDVSDKQWRGGTRYRISGRAECMRCHNMWNNFTAAFDPLQLARFDAFPEQSPEHVAVALGLTSDDFFSQHEERQLVSSRSSGPIDQRARSWLHANCSHCHRRHGGGTVPLELNYDLALEKTATISQVPIRGDFGLTDPGIIVPSAPWQSVLNYRISAIDHGHMPPIGSREVDEHGAALLWQWVANMESASTNPETVLPSVDRFAATISTSAAMIASHQLATRELEPSLTDSVRDAGLAATRPNIRALFERHRPAFERPRPPKISIDQVLSRTGNATAGKQLLTSDGKLADCLKCHRLGSQGTDLGPELTRIAGRLSRRKLIESPIEPSASIANEYRQSNIVTLSGAVYTGIIVRDQAPIIAIKRADGKVLEIAKDDVDVVQPQTLSMMPEGLLNGLTDVEIDDLLAYLATLL